MLDAASFDRTYAYEYDGNGNITKITYGGQSIRYTYDSQNQLIREDNQAAGKTWVWIYDGAGNITSKKEYAYTTGALGTVQDSITYSYPTSGAWKDLLTSYDGKTISYDAIGNPLSDGTWTYTWEQGRQLVRMSYAQNSWNFTYDSNGMRTRRSNAGTGDTYTYTYNGSQLSRMTYGSNTMWFTYGADGKPLSINYNGTTYYYVTNLQGDVVAILNSAGTAVVNYTYDAWGKPLTTTGSMANTLGMVNPLRYRGYVYDRETGLYYLQSRYYNPTWGRFINADTYISTGQGILGHNMFVYCNNNPVINIDPTGELLIEALVFIGVSAVVGALAGTFTAACTGGDLLEGALEGAVLGAVAATATVLVPMLLPTASAATIAGVTFAAAGTAGFGIDILTQYISHESGNNASEPFQVDWGRSAKTALTTGIAGVVPTYGNPTKSLINAVGSLVMGFDASFINAAVEIAIVNLLP